MLLIIRQKNCFLHGKHVFIAGVVIFRQKIFLPLEKPVLIAGVLKFSSEKQVLEGEYMLLGCLT